MAENNRKRDKSTRGFRPNEKTRYAEAQGSVTEEILKRQQQKDDGYFVEGEQIGSFTVISRLGEGASGTVYKVKNSLGDIEALKIAPPELLGHSRYLEVDGPGGASAGLCAFQEPGAPGYQTGQYPDRQRRQCLFG